MIIHSINIRRIRIPLKQPFVTAVRTTTAVEAVQVAMISDDGAIGYGEAPSVPAVTGETLSSIEEAIRHHITPGIIGRSIYDPLPKATIYGNLSAKAAVEMAWYDLRAQKANTPLYQLLGASKNNNAELTTDITISAGSLETMTENALAAIKDGFSILKIKTGTNPDTDAAQLLELWRNISSHAITLRIDANQGWNPQNAINIIRSWEDAGIPIDLVEQPVPAWDIEGLATVQAHLALPIAADESVLSVADAKRCIRQRAVRVINIKLMKAGGIGPALEICELCRAHGIDCMISCMLESQISAMAAAHLAVSLQSGIQGESQIRVDLDSPLLCVPGGYSTEFSGPIIKLPDSPGIGTRPLT